MVELPESVITELQFRVDALDKKVAHYQRCAAQAQADVDDARAKAAECRALMADYRQAIGSSRVTGEGLSDEPRPRP